jgi:hypothetical protein
VLTYIDTSVVRVLDSSAPLPDMVNKTNVTGLGHVSHRAEVISTEPERSLRLEVTVAHNNWDPIVSTSHLKPFNTKINYPTKTEPSAQAF